MLKPMLSTISRKFPSRQNEADNGPAAAIAEGECCVYCPWFFST